MSENWKPGDVALVEAGCWANRKVALRLDEGWAHINGVNLDGDGVVFPVRRLVVIDPEDAHQVGQLADLFFQGKNYSLDAQMAALREFANPTPPKPEEPTGLGAVVEDANGLLWCRDVEGVDSQGEWYRKGATACQKYAAITAVRVLSQGVTQ